MCTKSHKHDCSAGLIVVVSPSTGLLRASHYLSSKHSLHVQWIYSRTYQSICNVGCCWSKLLYRDGGTLHLPLPLPLWWCSCRFLYFLLLLSLWLCLPICWLSTRCRLAISGDLLSDTRLCSCREREMCSWICTKSLYKDSWNETPA